MALHLSPSRSKPQPRTSSTCYGSTDSPSPRLRSPDQIGRSTPPKRKIPISFGQEPQYTQGQSRPLPPKLGSEGTSSLNQPTTPNDLQLPFSKRARSTPEHTVEPGESAIDDKPIPILGFKKKPYTSPCGMKEYVKRGHLINHENTCEICKPISQKEGKAEVQGKRVDSEHSSATEGEDIGRATTMRENATEVCQANPDNNRVSTPNSEPCKRNHKQDNSVERAISAEDLTSPDSCILADRKPSAEAEAIDSRATRAMTTDGMTLYLEDGIYLEGKPLSGLRSGSLRLHDRLKEKFERKLTPKDQRGCVYVFADPGRPHLHKIGRAKKTIKRMGQLRYSCGLRLELVESVEVENYVRTESLIHAYISDLCRPYTCERCGTRHGEWFEVTDESARAYVDKWANFMTQERPYSADSKELQPFFRNLVRLRERLLKGLENDEFRKGWVQILSPTAMDRFGYRFGIVWEMFWKFYWPVNATIAWTITFVAIQHPVIFALTSASVIGTFITMAQEYHHTKHDSMITTRKLSK